MPPTSRLRWSDDGWRRWVARPTVQGVPASSVGLLARHVTSAAGWCFIRLLPKEVGGCCLCGAVDDDLSSSYVSLGFERCGGASCTFLICSGMAGAQIST